MGTRLVFSVTGDYPQSSGTAGLRGAVECVGPGSFIKLRIDCEIFAASSSPLRATEGSGAALSATADRWKLWGVAAFLQALLV